MQRMFSICEYLVSINLNSFRTSSIKNMISIFDQWLKLKSLDLSSFETNKVIDMEKMFILSSALVSLDLRNFNTSSVPNIMRMFNECTNLKLLNLKSFTYESLSDGYIDNMFNNFNQSMIYCINKDNTLDDIKNLLSNFPNLYCSDDCYQNEDNKILQCNKTCIDDCQNDNIPYLSL